MIVEKSLGTLASKEDLKNIREELRAEMTTLREEVKETKKDMRAMMQIGFTAMGLLIAALGLFLEYLMKM